MMGVCNTIWWNLLFEQPCRIQKCNECSFNTVYSVRGSEMNITGTLPPLLLMAKSWSQILRDTLPRHACLGEVSRESASRQSRQPRVESVYSTPKIFGAEFENSWRSGVRSFTFTSVGARGKSTCCRFKLFLESYLWRGKVKFGIICDLGVTFNSDWRIFGVRFTPIPPWPRTNWGEPERAPLLCG